MTRYRSLLLLFVLFTSGCATAPPYNPFKVPESEFRGRIKTVALAPLVLPDGLEEPDKVKAGFESLVNAKLQAVGFAVVPSAEYAAVWKQMSEQLGGFFDPVTGKKDETKYKAVRTHSLRELNTKFKADAVFYPAVRMVHARFSNNEARWDGATESVLKDPGFLATILTGPREGSIGAISFVALIEDTNEVMQYVNSGGIQLAFKLSGSTFTPVSMAELFKDEQRNAAAVSRALEPLATRPTATAGAAPKP